MNFRLTTTQAISIAQPKTASHPWTQSFDQQLGFRTRNDTILPQMTNSFSAFMAEAVTSIRAAMLGLARRRDLEPAFHSLMCLLLWHFLLSANTTSRQQTGSRCEPMYTFPKERAGEYSEMSSGL